MPERASLDELVQARPPRSNGAPNAKTQSARILRLLIAARGGWVSLPEIMACAAQYNARVFELRRMGFNVENRTECVDGVRHSWFRLVNSCSEKAPESPKPDAPAVNKPNQWLERQHEREVGFQLI